MGRLFFAMSLQRPKPRVRWLSYGGSSTFPYYILAGPTQTSWRVPYRAVQPIAEARPDCSAPQKSRAY